MRFFLGMFAAGAMSIAASSASASVVFDFGVGPNGVSTSSWAGSQGVSHAYTASGLTVTASAFGAPKNGHADQLYGKDLGGDENGLGMTNDPSGQNEIYYNKGFIQLDLSQLYGHIVAGSDDLSFGSSTQNEQWTIYGSNTAGVLGSILLPGSKTLVGSGGAENTLVQLTGNYRYYDVVSTSSSGGKNVLLKSLTVSPTPEPATWAMMLMGVGAVGGLLRNRRKQAAVAVTA